MTWFVVEVVALADWEDLDPEDVDAQGECIVDGSYLVAASHEQAALESFHHQVPIACLEDFLISVRARCPQDGLASFREVL